MTTTMTISGNVGSEPEHKVTASGLSVTTFRLASTPRIRREGEWTDDGTIWLTVHTYRSLAENAFASLHKGEPVIVTGRLRLEAWVGSDGQGRERKVIDADHVGHDLALGRAEFRRSRRASNGTSGESAGSAVADGPAAEAA